jgi:hypothetical protein
MMGNKKKQRLFRIIIFIAGLGLILMSLLPFIYSLRD